MMVSWKALPPQLKSTTGRGFQETSYPAARRPWRWRWQSCWRWGWFSRCALALRAAHRETGDSDHQVRPAGIDAASLQRRRNGDCSTIRTDEPRKNLRTRWRAIAAADEFVARKPDQPRKPLATLRSLSPRVFCALVAQILRSFLELHSEAQRLSEEGSRAVTVVGKEFLRSTLWSYLA